MCQKTSVLLLKDYTSIPVENVFIASDGTYQVRFWYKNGKDNEIRNRACQTMSKQTTSCQPLKEYIDGIAKEFGRCARIEFCKEQKSSEIQSVLPAVKEVNVFVH